MRNPGECQFGPGLGRFDPEQVVVGGGDGRAVGQRGGWATLGV